MVINVYERYYKAEAVFSGVQRKGSGRRSTGSRRRTTLP